ncbi:MAG TPA: hypothetical protein VKA94_01905 [Hyphomicrobiales bacterium]|nr:hypothetical protein [Hyphomicrobiales bacterium]
MTSEKGKKGFAGIDSMVSDSELAFTEPPSSRKEPQPEAIQQPSDQGIYEAKPQSTTGTPGVWWAVGIGLVVLFIWIGNSNHRAPTRSSSSPDPASTQNYSLRTSTTAPERPPYGSRTEKVPSIGSGVALNGPEIRYCLSEKIRMSGWRSAINEYSETSIDAFNNAVNDYNARCSNFRYRSGTLESIRAEVEANREALAIEGKFKAAMNP